MARRLAASSCNASQLSACLVTVFTICAPDVVARPSILRLYCLCHPAAAVKSSPMSEVGSQVWHETFSQLFRPPLPKIHRGIKSAIFSSPVAFQSPRFRNGADCRTVSLQIRNWTQCTLTAIGDHSYIKCSSWRMATASFICRRIFVVAVGRQRPGLLASQYEALRTRVAQLTCFKNVGRPLWLRRGESEWPRPHSFIYLFELRIVTQ